MDTLNNANINIIYKGNPIRKPAPTQTDVTRQGSPIAHFQNQPPCQPPPLPCFNFRTNIIMGYQPFLGTQYAKGE